MQPKLACSPIRGIFQGSCQETQLTLLDPDICNIRTMSEMKSWIWSFWAYKQKRSKQINSRTDRLDCSEHWLTPVKRVAQKIKGTWSLQQDSKNSKASVITSMSNEPSKHLPKYRTNVPTGGLDRKAKRREQEECTDETSQAFVVETLGWQMREDDEK